MSGRYRARDNALSKREQNPRKQRNPNAKASKMSGFRRGRRQLRKSPFKVHCSDKTRGKSCDARKSHSVNPVAQEKRTAPNRKPAQKPSCAATKLWCVKITFRNKTLEASGGGILNLTRNREVAAGPSPAPTRVSHPPPQTQATPRACTPPSTHLHAATKSKCRTWVLRATPSDASRRLH